MSDPHPVRLNLTAGAASVVVAALLVALKLWALGETGALSVAASLADSAMDLMISLAAMAALMDFASTAAGIRPKTRRKSSVMISSSFLPAVTIFSTTWPRRMRSLTASPFIKCSAWDKFGSVFTSVEATDSRLERPKVVRK